jgi:hypothetical protein
MCTGLCTVRCTVRYGTVFTIRTHYVYQRGVYQQLPKLQPHAYRDVRLPFCWCNSRVGQNRIYTPYMTVYLVIFLPNLPCIYRIYMVLANSTHFPPPFTFCHPPGPSELDTPWLAWETACVRAFTISACRASFCEARTWIVETEMRVIITANQNNEVCDQA